MAAEAVAADPQAGLTAAGTSPDFSRQEWKGGALVPPFRQPPQKRPCVDRTFAKYLEAMARYQKGDDGKDTLMRVAWRAHQTSPLTAPARTEMARNLVVMIRSTGADWDRDPLLSDPQAQAALVEEMKCSAR